jgi:hypothetical protein
VRQALRAFGVLAGEALRDGLRRRFAFAVALFMLAGLVGAESCTDFSGAELNLNGHSLPPALLAGLLSPLLLAWQALAVVAIAGIVASDHLARPLAEGSAVLWLARPVSRPLFAGARLAGALGVALGAGTLLLGGSAALIVLRQHLSLSPALAACAATALASIAVAALAMAASLALGRAAVLLLVLIGVPWIALANAATLVAQRVQPGAEPGGVLGAIDRFGPPIGTAILAAVAPWNPHFEGAGELGDALLRLALWAGGGVTLLLIAFHRVEIDSS